MDQVDHHAGANDTNSIINKNNKDDEDEDEDMMISAAAASSALMGENIIDSPNTRSHKTNPRFFHSPQQQEDNETIHEQLPDIPDLTSTMETSVATAGLNSSSHHRDRANCDPNNNNNNNATSVGIVAQGWAWAKQQKYKRQRQYLQHQAEQQLLKLQLATTTTTSTMETQSMQQQKNELVVDEVNVNENNNDKTNKRSLFFDPTSLQNWIESLTSIPVLSTQHDDVESDQHHHHRRRRNMGRTNSSESVSNKHYDPNSSVSVHDKDTDRTDYGNISNYQFCNISQSGLGYSVELPTLFNTPPSQSTTTTTSTTNQQNTTSTIDNENDDDTSWIPQVRVEDATSYDDYNSAIHSDHSNDNDDDCTTKMQQQENHHNSSVTEIIEEVRPPYLLTSDEMYQIAVYVLPRNIVYCKWKRYYSLVRDGDSFDNCLRQVQHCKQSLMIIRTTKNYRFGTYVDAPWDTTHSLQHGTIQYYGGPETCLFKIVNDNVDAGNDNTTQDKSCCSGGGKVICYKWSGMNRYIQLCDHQNKMIAIGGGNGTFGLCIQQDFQYGSTGSCATFNNDPLCPDEQFSILDIEIYGFLLGQF